MNRRLTRRNFLRAAGLTLLTPYVVLAGYSAAENRFQAQPDFMDDDSEPWFRFDANAPSEAVFGISVASGDPTPSGVILWTRVNPEVWSRERKLAFEVAEDAAFGTVVVRGLVDGRELGPERDWTAKLDLDGRLQADRLYYYRFIYDGHASRTGRCRTLPAPGSSPERVKFGVLTCQDFTNGYYAAYYHLSQEPDVAFMIHLGDFIYESSGDPRYQDLPYEDRRIILPSGGTVALGLEDFRFIYRTYRSDPYLQLALETHTLIPIWDDHECANDSYWDYERDTLGAPDHPFTLDSQYGNDPTLLRRLKLDSQRAWAEYVPARPVLNTSATDPHEFMTIYRSFGFGDLLDLVMGDERSYRSPHPCGEGDYGERYGTPRCDEMDDPDRTMLGLPQRDWLIQQLTGSQALWKVWGNQVFQGPIAIPSATAPLTTLYLNVDAWDGYEFERTFIMSALKGAGLENVIVLTGDLHTYIASYLKIDYNQDPLNVDQENLVGVEFMTPAVTSSNLKEIAGIPDELDPALVISEPVVRAANPHIQFFNSDNHGYSTVEFTREYTEYVAYAISKDEPDAQNAPKSVLKRLQVPVGQVVVNDVT